MLIPPGYPVHIYVVVCVIPQAQDPAVSLTSLAGVQIVVQSLLGLLVGWGIGSAAMKASIAVRSHLVDESTLQKAVNKSVTSRVI